MTVHDDVSCSSVHQQTAVAWRSISLVLASWIGAYLQKIGFLLVSCSLLPPGCALAESLRRRAMAPVVNTGAAFRRTSNTPAAVVADNNNKEMSQQQHAAVMSPTQGSSRQFAPLAVVLVGLPARGKTVLANKLSRFLTWIGHPAKVFSVSEYRRKRTEQYDSHDFFRADNEAAMEIRKQCSFEALDDACDWLVHGGSVAVLDGTNASVSRRQQVYERLVRRTGCKVLFVECICEDEEVVQSNTKHGESENNILGRIGGDADLSPRGRKYALSLAKFINEATIPGLRVLTSELKRTHQTDKLRYRYPWGESYVDIMTRLEPVIIELEHTSNILVVSHQAVLRCLLGYFLGKGPDELPYLDVPLHTIIKLTTEGHESHLEFIRLPVECVDTYRQKPKNCSADRSQEDALMTVPSHFDSTKFWEVAEKSDK
ncbi:hypothetical protein B566_EDAN004016 [Ephemera danica]|nr:hypothetical protein B566_EDAN004016 [Ephemera danica]